ncbi:MAG TPA: hypothetical protein VJC09_00130 [Candidatus Saccharimonadales bacterium]|nr:hypothetical protein [Candidatus Saccharimonadales bacterium]
MIPILAGLVLGFSILLFVENLHKHKRISTEMARKIIHLEAGLILIVWSFLINWQSIVAIEIIFLAVVGVTRWFKFFDSQNGINRITWGEFFFPVGVILAIMLGAPRWVFILAMLHLAVADAAAALIGKKYGKGNSYEVLGQKKSVAGSLAFFAVSLILIIGATIIAPSGMGSIGLVSLLFLPIITTMAENLGVYGSDNLIIPLVVVLLLS